ncbi:MAG: hypothetical protein NZ583_05445 [Desulfobacterota bacterium]|nr:hypothetical protein [Thermodesulfobacteriota bacterium]MDW8002370.1 hypothetical protein [Deltaproteobacteria bacterium]
MDRRILFSSVIAFLFSFLPALFISGWKRSGNFIENVLSAYVPVSFFDLSLNVPYRFFLAASVVILYVGIYPLIRGKTN